MEKLLLASNSPRRRELLEGAGIPFELFAHEVDESVRDELPPESRVLALAEDKARAAAALAPASAPRLVLAADTLVCLPSESPEGESSLGKPRDEKDAERMLRLLSGRDHFVRSGLALFDRFSGELRTGRSDSRVRFSALSEGEFFSYLGTREWVGVAGAYRIQGLASLFIERLEGSWTGVVGLPMRELYVILCAAGFRIPSLKASGRTEAETGQP